MLNCRTMKFQPGVVTILLLGTICASFCHGTSPGNVVGGGYPYQPQQQQQQWNQEQQQYGQYGAHIEEHQPTATEALQEDNSLPEGWVEYMDQSSGRPYYYNENDGTTTWDKPVKELKEDTQSDSMEFPTELEVHQATSTNEEDTQELKLEEVTVDPSYYQGYEISGDPEEKPQEESQPEQTPESDPGPEPQQQTYVPTCQWFSKNLVCLL